jgi:uncharacterized membrane protein
MASDKFRRQLRQESEQWQTDGIISAEQRQQLATRYQFDRLDLAARDRFIFVVIGIGSVLLGLGVITFVAANWQVIPRVFKLLLLLTLMVGTQVGGFYLWRSPNAELPNSESPRRPRQRFGEGLLLLGSIILGANMALTGQMFHISGSSTDLCIIWGLAVLAMAYALRLTSMGVLAFLITGLGYWIGTIGWWENPASDSVQWVIDQMPLVIGVAFMPLAYWCRSRWLFGLGAFALSSSLYTVGGQLAERLASYYSALGIWLVLSSILPIALLWSYDDRLGSRVMPDTSRFRNITRVLAALGLMLLVYVLSFHYAWDTWNTQRNPPQWSEAVPWLLNPSLMVFTGLTLVQWIALARRPVRSGVARSGWRLSQTDGGMAVFLVVIAGLTFWHWGVAPIQVVATFLANVMMFLLAIALMRDGLARGKRYDFWGGLGLITLQIASRLLEYETALLLKSLVFLGCGIGVMVIGLWFERYVRTLRTTSEEES